MTNIVNLIYYALSTWDEQYANAWKAYIQSTYLQQGHEGNPYHNAVCRFWALELAAVNASATQKTRLHFVPSNSMLVLEEIFKQEILPFIIENESEFKELSKCWDSYS